MTIEDLMRTRALVVARNWCNLSTGRVLTVADIDRMIEALKAKP